MNTDMETFQAFFCMRSAIWSDEELFNVRERDLGSQALSKDKQWTNAKDLNCFPSFPLTE